MGRRDPDILKPHERELLEKSRGTAEIIVEKSRNGPIGTTKLHYDAELISFGSLTRAEVR